jgi:hypothetical protein
MDGKEEGLVKIGKVTISTDEYLELKTKELQEKHNTELNEMQDKMDEINHILNKVAEEKGYLKFGTSYNGFCTVDKKPEYVSCDDVTKEFLDKLDEKDKEITTLRKELTEIINSLKDDLESRNEQILGVLGQDKKLANTYKLLELFSPEMYSKYLTKTGRYNALLKLYAKSKGNTHIEIDKYSGFRMGKRITNGFNTAMDWEEVDVKDFVDWILKELPFVNFDIGRKKEEDTVLENKEAETVIIEGKEVKGIKRFFNR